MMSPIRMMAKTPQPIANPMGETLDHFLIITGAGIGELVDW